MESSSIVSFNNDSTFQSTLKPEQNISVHELALHAMRDRCLVLQRRINTLEADNMKLKLDLVKNSGSSSYMPLEETEKSSLLHKVAELTKQKSQLMHHVFMVSCENRNLWNKVSNINKIDQRSKEQAKHPLIRTNTYIHSTPKTNVSNQDNYLESSLEDISLKLINSYIQEKSQLVEQYEQMAQLQDIDNDVLNLDSIGFGYMEDPPTDSLKEIRTQTEKLHNLRKDFLQQDEDLKLIISRVKKIFKEGYNCPSCQQKNTKAISSEHKEIETSDSLANWATPTESTNYNENYTELNSSYKKDIDHSDSNADEISHRICPMCGQNFQRNVAFSEFQSHVESHFVGEMEHNSLNENVNNTHNSVDNVM